MKNSENIWEKKIILTKKILRSFYQNSNLATLGGRGEDSESRSLGKARKIVYNFTFF